MIGILNLSWIWDDYFESLIPLSKRLEEMSEIQALYLLALNHIKFLYKT